MDNTVIDFVNKNHAAVRVAEQQNQALEMVSRANHIRAEKEAARKKKQRMSMIVDILLVVAFFAAIVVSFGVVYHDHFGPLSYNGQIVSEMTPTQQLQILEEVR